VSIFTIFFSKMIDSAHKTTFPVIDLAEMLIPWEKCFKVHVGAIDLRAIKLMDEKKYDFAPVFDHQRTRPGVLGLISAQRLKEIGRTTGALPAGDPDIIFPEIQSKISMSAALDLMVSRTAYIVIHGGPSRGHEANGLFTRADLNKHPFRAAVYSLIAHLETELAKLVRNSFSDPWEWLAKLSDEKLARIMGYWEVSKRRGVDIGPVGAMTLSELLNVTGKIERLRSGLGFHKPKVFREVTGRIPELRNQIMHPVRPLITDTASITRLKEDVETVMHISQRLRSAKRLQKAAAI
jgi:hypothetical protein